MLIFKRIHSFAVTCLIFIQRLKKLEFNDRAVKKMNSLLERSRANGNLQRNDKWVRKLAPWKTIFYVFNALNIPQNSYCFLVIWLQTHLVIFELKYNARAHVNVYVSWSQQYPLLTNANLWSRCTEYLEVLQLLDM